MLSLPAENVARGSDFVQCPSEVRVTETIQGNTSDWKAFDSDEKHPYVGISFSEGAPDQKLTLAPTQEKQTKGGILAVWDFTASSDRYWVSCLYAETSATVAQKLPSDIQSCEVEYDTRSSPPLARTWRCRSQTNQSIPAADK